MTEIIDTFGRGSFDAILNQIIPPNAERRIPGAGEIDVAAFVGSAIAGNSGSAELFATGLARVSEMAADAGGAFETLSASSQVEILREVERSHSAFFAEMIRTVYMGYYSRPDIRARLGLAATPVQPTGYTVAPEPPELLAELTAPVRARGEIFRDI